MKEEHITLLLLSLLLKIGTSRHCCYVATCTQRYRTSEIIFLRNPEGGCIFALFQSYTIYESEFTELKFHTGVGHQKHNHTTKLPRQLHQNPELY